MIARALTIAGSDSGGGAGIQQDLTTFHAVGVYGMTAITAVTVQNTVGVSGWHAVPPGVVAAQIEAVVTDIGVDAAKTGMLPDPETVIAVARAVRDHGVSPLVVDPVMVATSGDELATGDMADTLVHELFPLAAVVTPNAAEAARLAGFAVTDAESQIEAARAIVARGARAVLVKGGDVDGDEARDVLVDGDRALWLAVPRVATPHTHGTGCALSAAIAAHLARGESLPTAVQRGKDLVTRAIERSLAIGKGRGPVNPAGLA